MQRYELEAWLGDDHGLSEDQIGRLLTAADEIGQRYTDPDDADEREAALTVAYRLMVESHPTVLRELSMALTDARRAQAMALAALRQCAVLLVPTRESESSFARQGGVDRMAVRGWLGKR